MHWVQSAQRYVGVATAGAQERKDRSSKGREREKREEYNSKRVCVYCCASECQGERAVQLRLLSNNSIGGIQMSWKVMRREIEKGRQSIRARPSCCLASLSSYSVPHPPSLALKLQPLAALIQESWKEGHTSSVGN